MDVPEWLWRESTEWPKQFDKSQISLPEEEREVCHIMITDTQEPLISTERYSSFVRLNRVTAWVFQFINNCCAKVNDKLTNQSPSLFVSELASAENYWLSIIQKDHFSKEVDSIRRDSGLPNNSCLIPLYPFLDPAGLLRVGGREQNSKLSYASMHPIILQGKHPITRLLVHSEHLRLLHAGPVLLWSSLSHRFHIVGGQKIVRTVTRGCIVCRRQSARPTPQIMGRLPVKRVTPGPIFDKVGVDFADPLVVKYGKDLRSPKPMFVCLYLFLSKLFIWNQSLT